MSYPTQLWSSGGHFYKIEIPTRVKKGSDGTITVQTVQIDPDMSSELKEPLQVTVGYDDSVRLAILALSSAAPPVTAGTDEFMPKSALDEVKSFFKDWDESWRSRKLKSVVESVAVPIDRRWLDLLDPQLTGQAKSYFWANASWHFHDTEEKEGKGETTSEQTLS